MPHVKLSSFEGMVPKGEDWRTIKVSEEELKIEAAQVADRSAVLEDATV